MANTLKFKRGLVSGIPTAALGEPLFTTDTFDLYIGNGTGNTRFQKYIASGTTSQLLRGDGSLLTMPIVLTSPTNGQVLKFNGTNWVNDSDAGITGTGVSGQVSYWTGTGTQSGSNNLFWDNANKKLSVGLNTSGIWSSYNSVLQIGQGIFSDLNLGNFTQFGINSNLYYNGTNSIVIRTGGTGYINFNNDGNIEFANGASQTAGATWTGTAKMRLHNTGNLVLGGTVSTDNGARLQISGNTTMKGSGNTNTTNALIVSNSDSNLLMSFNNAGSFLFGQNGQRGYISITDALTTLGLQTLTFQSNLTISNTRLATQSIPNGVLFITRDGLETTTVGTDTKLLYIGHRASDGFAPTSGTAIFIAQVIAPRINQTGGANGITRGLYVNPTLTAAANWRSIEWSNNTGWGLYGAGTANNYLAGSLGIGSTSLTGYSLRVGKTIVGALSSTGIYQDGTVQSTVTSNAFGIYNSARTQAAAFTLTNYYHFYTDQFALGAGSAITNQYGYVADNTLTGATNNFGFYGNIASGTGRWNLYMNGSAANFLSGNTQIGTGALTGEKLQVNGTMKVTGASTFGGNMSLTLNQNAPTNLTITNTTNGTSANAYLRVASNAITSGSFDFGKFSASTTAYKIILANDALLYNSGTAGDISILNDFASGSIKMAAGSSSTAHFTIASTGAATFSSSIQAGTAIAIGTTPDTNKPFKILKNINATVGINFENTSTGSTAFSAIQMGTDVTGGTKFTNLVYGSGGITQSGVYHPDGTSLINNGGGGLNFLGTPIRFYTGGSNGTLRLYFDNEGTTQFNATSPTTSITDGYRQYSADVTAGNAAPHFRTENGAVIKLYQETTSVGNAIISLGGGNAVLDDTTFDGYTLRQIVKALRNQGILA